MTNKTSNSILALVGRCFLSFLGKLVVFLVLGAAFLFLIRVLPGNITYEYSYGTPELSASTQSPGEKEPTDTCLLREEDGIVGIFDAEGKLIKSANLDLSTLTEYDRQLLSQGIRGEMSALEHLLEELLS